MSLKLYIDDFLGRKVIYYIIQFPLPERKNVSRRLHTDNAKIYGPSHIIPAIPACISHVHSSSYLISPCRNPRGGSTAATLWHILYSRHPANSLPARTVPYYQSGEFTSCLGIYQKSIWLPPIYPAARSNHQPRWSPGSRLQCPDSFLPIAIVNRVPNKFIFDFLQYNITYAMYKMGKVGFVEGS